ncbi:MAG: Holliday junction branch migration protein RuvA [Candidatus Omnitrophica bacterium]|nr:Holliday junction branch migration protein RuvA [Candidatus Omnitrophota bacterium]
MISRLYGTLIERKETTALLETNGVTYEVFIPKAVMHTLERHVDPQGKIRLVTFHYHHLEPSRAVPILIGFLNEIEREFFETFITVSGIGPKAAVRAINQPIAMIARAIDDGNTGFLRSLPGIGPQRAKEIIAKLQGKVGKYALIPDGEPAPASQAEPNAAAEALEVLLQLQYRRSEAQEMIKKALGRNPALASVEEILNEVYKQRAQGSPKEVLQ